MATKKKQPSTLSRVARMEREYQDKRYEFEPTEQPAPEAKRHHFAVNGNFVEEDLDELRSDVDSILVDARENADVIPFVRQQIGLHMMNWHSSQGDPIYAVGSTYFSERGAFAPYQQLAILESARSNLERDLRREKAHPQEEFPDAVDELEIILDWLGWEIGLEKMVNNPRRNPGTSVIVEFADGATHEVRDTVELEELAHEHGKLVNAVLRQGRSTQKAFWGEWSRQRWPRTIADVAAWFDSIERFDDAALRAVSRIWHALPPPRTSRHENRQLES